MLHENCKFTVRDVTIKAERSYSIWTIDLEIVQLLEGNYSFFSFKLTKSGAVVLLKISESLKVFLS